MVERRSPDPCGHVNHDELEPVGRAVPVPECIPAAEPLGCDLRSVHQCSGVAAHESFGSGIVRRRHLGGCGVGKAGNGNGREDDGVAQRGHVDSVGSGGTLRCELSPALAMRQFPSTLAIVVSAVSWPSGP